MKPCRVLILPLLLALCAPAVRADDWPLPRHDAGNTGFVLQRLAPPLRLAWRVPTQLTGRTLMASGGVISQSADRFASSRPPAMLFRADNGRVVWSLPDVTPVYLHGRQWVVATHRPGGDTLDSYDWQTRQKQWSYPLGGQWSTPVVAGGSLYVGLGGAPPVVAVVSAATGAETQRYTLGPTDSSHILAIWNQTVALGGLDWVRFRDRATLMSGFAVYNGGTSVLMHGTHAVGQGFGHWAVGMDLASRSVAWRMPAWRDAASVLVKGRGGKMLVLLASASPAEIKALDIPTGKVVWRHALIAGAAGIAPSLAGTWNVAYVPGGHVNVPGGPRGGFYALDGATGRVLWKYEKPGVQGAAVIASDGALYGLDTKGFLYKFVR